MPTLGAAEISVSPGGRGSCTTTLLAVLGPALLKVTVKVMVSPALGVVLLTVLLKPRSACWGVSVALALLFAVLGSNWSARLIAAVFVCALGLTTWARSCKVCGAPVVTVPTLHRPVPLLYVPWLGAADTKLRPAGNRSLSWTLLALLGPLSVSVIVKVIVSPTLGVGLLTLFCTARSACCGVSVALLLLLPGLGSN